MTHFWLLALVFFAFQHAHAEEQVQPPACLATAVKSARSFLQIQENFYKCYKDCSRSIVDSTAGYAEHMPDFTLNLIAMSKSAGVSICSRLCYDKINDKVPANTAAQPFLAFNEIAQKLEKCIENDKSNPYINALTQFNIDNLNNAPTFVDPRQLNLFSIFYPDHLQYFWAGVPSSPDNCPDNIRSLKASLSAYTNNLNLCQHWCLTSFANPAASGHDSFSMLNTVARCQNSCFYLFRVNPSPKKSVLHPASEIYHSLQYCFWHTGAKSFAREHAASFSLLEPSDTSLTDYYVGSTNVPKEEFLPKPDAIHLQEQLKVLTEIVKMNGASGDGTPARLAAVVNSLKVYDSGVQSKKETISSSSGTCDASGCDLNVNAFRVVANFTGIETYRRYVVDNVLDTSQCAKLIALNKKGGEAGDGYLGTKKGGSPYTAYESFNGLAMKRLPHLLTSGIVTSEDVMLFLGVIDGVKEKTKQLHGLKELYLHYTHLVCREAIKSEGETFGDTERDLANDPSHPLHSDNCIVQENGECLDIDPAISPRNYSAVLYLNSDFEGGEIYFSHRPDKIEEARVSPQCGRFVTFQSGEYHAVNAVKKGIRCSMAMWFTMDKSKEETGRASVDEVISELANLMTKETRPVDPEISEL